MKDFIRRMHFDNELHCPRCGAQKTRGDWATSLNGYIVCCFQSKVPGCGAQINYSEFDLDNLSSERILW